MRESYIPSLDGNGLRHHDTAMSEELNADVRNLAQQVAACEDEDVADFGGCIAKPYDRERMVALGLIGIDLMVSGQEREPDEYAPRLVACRERMRDRLKTLLAWAKVTRRM